MYRCGNLLKVDHITLGKNAATPCNSWWVFRFEGKFTKLIFNGYANAVGLLVKEGTRSCCAESIEFKIGKAGSAVFGLLHEDQLGIFSTHLDDGPDLRV